MKRLFSILATTFLITQVVGQSGEVLSFTNFGPVAFDSFWRIPTVTSGYEQLTFHTFSRISDDHLTGNYFTQYFRADVPIGAGNGLSIRMPRHQFNVETTGATRLGMANQKGGEWGDIDFIFTIKAFQNFFDQWAGGRYNLLFIGEMHTAPTSRANRQFTDTIKMLGLIGFTGTWDLGGATFMARNFIGVGGWQDDELPRQNHVFKISPSIAYQRSVSSKWELGTTLGLTYLSGEKANDEGLYWQGGVFLQSSRFHRLTLSYGNIQYTEQENGHVNQWQLGISVPIWFTGFQKVDAFSGS